MSVPLQIALHILTACATLAVGLSLHLFSQPSRVVEVDSEAILRTFVAEQGTLSDEELERRSGQFMSTMQAVLDRYALRNGVIVVEARLAIAGAEDISDEAYRQAVFMLPASMAELEQ